jgi:hypothetical protein
MASDPEAEYWEEDAKRINKLSKLAKKLGYQVKTGEDTPELNEDGSLKEEELTSNDLHNQYTQMKLDNPTFPKTE